MQHALVLLAVLSSLIRYASLCRFLSKKVSLQKCLQLSTSCWQETIKDCLSTTTVVKNISNCNPESETFRVFSNFDVPASISGGASQFITPPPYEEGRFFLGYSKYCSINHIWMNACLCKCFSILSKRIPEHLTSAAFISFLWSCFLS